MSEEEYEFVVEFVLASQLIIGARAISSRKFQLTDKSTLGGLWIEPWLDQPRASDGLGNPRSDLFAFRLKDSADVEKISAGMTLKLCE